MISIHTNMKLAIIIKNVTKKRVITTITVRLLSTKRNV